MKHARPDLAGLVGQTLARGRTLLRGLRTNFFWDPDSTDNIPVALQRWAAERPHDPYLSFEGRHWTIGAFDAGVNRHAVSLAIMPGNGLSQLGQA